MRYRFIMSPKCIATCGTRGNATCGLFPRKGCSFRSIIALPAKADAASLTIALGNGKLAPKRCVLPVHLSGISLFGVTRGTICPLMIQIIKVGLSHTN